MGFVQHRHPFTPYDRAPGGDAAAFRAMPIRDDMLPPPPDGEFRHRVGVRPLDLAEWLPVDEETEPTIAMKRALLAERRDEVVACASGGEAAAEEAAGLVADWRGASLERNGIDALVEAALLVADDLTVLGPVDGDGGAPRFVAGVVCAPSRWSLRSKMGRTMLETHGPVPRYAEHIGAAVDTLLRRLSADRPVWRSNWTLVDHPALFQPEVPDGPLVDDPSQLWVRMERETLRRLPRTGGILFTIRGFQQPLPEYVARGRGHARIVRDLVARLPDDVARYKSVLPHRAAVSAWLDACC
ncbi:MAG: DUF3445 domain-containing protein [Actinobacteria bacterium]|nr:DUF3445 domain-containing protein [Actinomycetota bacterium]